MVKVGVGSRRMRIGSCGREELNRFLQQYALQNQQSGGAQTYVGLVDQSVVGYYALAAGSVEQEDAPERTKKGLAKHSIPSCCSQGWR